MQNSRPFLLLPALLSLFFVVIITNTNAQVKTLKDSLQAIDKLFENSNTATPGGVLSISRQGEVLYKKAFGMADLERHAVNTTETIFEAGSVSKQFTAAAVFLLVKDGKIGLKDDIHKYFPDFPDYGYPVLIEYLLHHTSGLRDWGSVAAIGGWPRGTRKYTLAHVKEIIWRQKQLNFIPNAEYSYSNSNYNLLLFLVEKVSGQPFQQFTYERLFKPLGMLHTRWRDNYNAIVAGRSIAYSKDESGYQQNMPFENTFGHGALLTTVDDLEKWNRRWTNNSFGADINAMQETKGILNNGQVIPYAGGVVVNTVNGVKQISHTGATAGYRALLMYYPQKEISIIYLSNDAGAPLGKISSTVSGLFIGEENAEKQMEKYAGIQVTKESLASKAGLYKHMRIEDVQELTVVNDSLTLKWSGLSLVPLSDNKFTKEGFVLQFPGGSGKPKSMLLQHSNGDTATYIRVNPFKGGEKELSLYTGTYQSEEADARVKLILKDGKLQVYMHPDTYLKLEPAYEDAFYDEDMSLYQVIRDNKKRITGFTITTGRVRNLLFTRSK